MRLPQPGPLEPMSSPTSPRASSSRSPPLTRRHGTPAPIRRAARSMRPRANGSTRSSPTPFLQALEASGSVGGRSGWTPVHVTVEDARGRIVAAAPCYLKSHSQGEYVFDHAWADAYERAGGRYYPKLQVAVPFTPVTGRRLLVAADAPDGAREALIGALARIAQADRRRPRFTPPFRPPRTPTGWRTPDFSSAPASSSIFSATATRISTISSARSPRASARRSNASGATRWTATSRSNG